jgi:hypothetical protein
LRLHGLCFGRHLFLENVVLRHQLARVGIDSPGLYEANHELIVALIHPSFCKRFAIRENRDAEYSLRDGERDNGAIESTFDGWNRSSTSWLSSGQEELIRARPSKPADKQLALVNHLRGKVVMKGNEKFFVVHHLFLPGAQVNSL